MCGICGIANWELADQRKVVSRMCATMLYRGPDDYGVEQLSGCCLGHRRLSIVDLSPTGHQPMRNENGSIWCVLNGEIYGFDKLVEELKQDGHVFFSRSDTEVILHGYESWGLVELCKRLTGMFAFAIWDQRINSLLLGRDRFGEKPLYYMRRGREIRFSSNTQALFIGIDTLPQVDPDGLVGYLNLGYCLPQFPIMRDVKVVPPGTCITFQSDCETIQQYWQASFLYPNHFTTDEWMDQVESALAASIRKQLLADVPVGLLLSGGVDSSLIASIATDIKPDLKMFTVRMPNFPQDESEKAKVIAKSVGGEHHILDAQPVTLDEFIAFQRTFAQPLGDSSSIAVWIISKYCKEHVKVLMTGDGGDELFAGYRTVTMNLMMENFRQFFKNPIGESVLRFLENALQPFTFMRPMRRAETFAHLLRKNLKDTCIERSRISNEIQISIWGSQLRVAAKEHQYQALLMDLWEDTDAIEPLGKLLNLDLKMGLVGDYLPKVDTATMACSMEARAPFLDHHLAELAFSIPPEIMRVGNKSKGLLKALLARRLGKMARQAIARKQGFVVPIDRWLDNEWNPLLMNLLESPLIDQEFIDRVGINQMFSNRKLQPERYTNLCYSLIVLDLWIRNLIKPQ